MTGNTITRRKLLQAMGFGIGAAALGVPSLGGLAEAKSAGKLASSTTHAAAGHPWYELGVIGDQVMDEQLLFYLSGTWSGTSDIGECLDTASRISADDLTSWPREWRKTSDRVLGMAEASEQAGHPISAGQAYLRSSNYDRAALMHHADPKDPEMLPLAQRSMESFGKAAELLSFPTEFIRVPYEDTTLPAWFWRSPVAGPKAPLMIVHQGRDAWAEDNKFIADACILRGLHCLMVHCPGQGIVLREQGLPFRYDWEHVITPFVDFAVAQPDIDPERIVLMGLSMGGGLAPRAAAFEKRIKICIANAGVLNWGQVVADYFAAISPEMAAAVANVETDPDTFNTLVSEMSKMVPQLQWAITDEMWKHGSKSPAELIIELKKFNNEPIIDQITCQTLVTDAAAEAWSTGQARPLYDALSCPKDYMLFTAEDTGQVHTQTGAHAVATQRIFDWLEENL